MVFYFTALVNEVEISYIWQSSNAGKE